MERGGIKSCYKRIYLQLMTFTLEVLNEDWSEIAPPDFDAIVSTVSNSERQRFAYILLLVCWKGDKQLKHEIEGLLAIFDKEQREKVLENLLLVHQPSCNPLANPTFILDWAFYTFRQGALSTSD